MHNSIKPGEQFNRTRSYTRGVGDGGTRIGHRKEDLCRRLLDEVDATDKLGYKNSKFVHLAFPHPLFSVRLILRGFIHLMLYLCVVMMLQCLYLN